MSKQLILAFSLVFAAVGCNLSDSGGSTPSNNATTNNATTNNATTNNATTNNTSTCSLACVNGMCVNDGQEYCDCDPGYTGARCEACAGGFQDNDDDGVCEADCTGVECGNGACESSSGTALCVCDDGYTGDACEMCDDGYQDNDDDGVCDISCTNPTLMLECGEGFCDDLTGMTTCVCPTGADYVAADMSCNLVVPVDPEFDDAPASSPWTPFGSARLDQTVAGNLDQGAAILGEDVCTMGGGVSQTYDLADRDQTGPLKVVLSYSTDCDRDCFEAGSPSLRSGTSFQTFPNKNSFQPSYYEETQCLGDAAYGLGTNLEVVTKPPRAECRYGWIDQIDHLNFVRATEDECPAPGTVRNGTLDEPSVSTDVPGWHVPSGSDPAEIVDVNGNLVLSIGSVETCRSAIATAKIGVPAGDTPYSLSYRYRVETANSDQGVVTIGDPQTSGLQFSIPESPQFRTNTVCLPRWMNGTYIDFSGRMFQSGLCGEPSTNRLYLDDVVLAPTPDCGDPADILRDGGFDQVLNNPWVLKEGYSATASFVTEGNERFVRLTAGECDQPAAAQSIIIEDAADAPNAIAFRYRYTDDGNTSARARLIPTTENVQLNDTAGAWENGEICIPEGSNGFPLRFQAGMSSSGSCAPGNPLPGRLEIDDVVLMTSTTCP